MTREDYLKYTGTIYHATRAVFKAVPADKMDYRPEAGMMSISQLIRHIASACGSPYRCVLENRQAPTEPVALPPLESFKGYDTVQEALEHLDRDEKELRELIMGLSEEEFQSRDLQPPWLPFTEKAWASALGMADHLSGHKMQLFMYLRLLGEPVNTATLYGMG